MIEFPNITKLKRLLPRRLHTCGDLFAALHVFLHSLPNQGLTLCEDRGNGVFVPTLLPASSIVYTYLGVDPEQLDREWVRRDERLTILTRQAISDTPNQS